MLWPRTISTDVSKGAERRGCRRETLDHYAVLVFLGNSDWGKLTNLSESGMCFEFSTLPSLRERVNFALQAVGCMPVGGGVSSKSFEVQGEIVWTREFERIAGAQFAELTEGSRGQIRHWLSFEASANTCESSQEGMKALALSSESLAPPACPSETLSEMAVAELFLTDGKASEASVELQKESELPFTERLRRASLAREYHAPVGAQKVKPKSVAASNRPAGRLPAIAVGCCLAVLALSVGVRMISPYWARRAKAGQRDSLPASKHGEPAGAVSNSSRGNDPPFQVEVLESSGKRWFLSFPQSVAKDGEEQVAALPAVSSNSDRARKKSAAQKQTASAAKPQAADKFASVRPMRAFPGEKLTAPGLLFAEAPALPVQPEVSLGELNGRTLADRAVPPPAADNPLAGGTVQQARLIRSVTPVYPAFAREHHVSGEVVLDGLIDSDGKVASAKAISGPVVLRQAAVETLRQWKYEPARLNGQPVATHLIVTMRFRSP